MWSLKTVIMLEVVVVLVLENFLLDQTLDFSTSVWKSSCSEKYQENVHVHFYWSCKRQAHSPEL